MAGISEAQVLEALSSIQDPDLGRDIVSLGFVKNLKIEGGKVGFSIELTTPACPVKDRFRQQAEEAVKAIAGVEEVAVNMTAQVRGHQAANPQQTGVPGIKHVIPVASGKGGVGKSTVSANIAVALAARGAKVGLMDADIYGPSIPTIMGANEAPRVEENRIIPPERYGVKIISMGFFVEESKAVVWRGPMLAKMIDEFLGNVVWGELDYLIVDLPPGTGDVQLSLCQKLALTGAVVVSTPQDVALKVAQKAISLFDTLKTPVLGLVENMSFFICGHCNEREEVFGHGGTRRAAELLRLPFLGELPLATKIRVQSDQGQPTVVADPESAHAEAFKAVAENLAAQVSIRSMSGELNPKIKVEF
jgi:ATP-binding protein involved in chromosome partitioning